MATLAYLLNSDLAEYRTGLPAGFSAEAVRADEAVLRETSCRVCGHPELELRRFHRGESYRALGYCPCCESAQEI